MNRILKSAPIVAALATGPLAAWLVWAIMNRWPMQIGIALAANIAFWIGAPALLYWEMENLS